jgi:hypothetical protein
MVSASAGASDARQRGVDFGISTGGKEELKFMKMQFI